MWPLLLALLPGAWGSAPPDWCAVAAGSAGECRDLAGVEPRELRGRLGVATLALEQRSSCATLTRATFPHAEIDVVPASIYANVIREGAECRVVFPELFISSFNVSTLLSYLPQHVEAVRLTEGMEQLLPLLNNTSMKTFDVAGLNLPATTSLVLPRLNLFIVTKSILTENSFDAMVAPRLKVIGLSNNTIMALSDGAAVFKNLQVLFLQENIFNAISVTEVIRFFPHLEKVVLIGNQGLLITEENFTLPNLLHFQFNQNAGNRIGILLRMLQRSPNLEKLDISCNVIYELPYDSFSNLRALKILNISHNVLTYFPELYEISLDILDLSWNNLLTLDGVFYGSFLVDQLDLSHNFIEKWFREDVFRTEDSSSWVRSVNLSHNRIRAISAAMTDSLKGLNFVDLSGNSLPDMANLNTNTLYSEKNATSDVFSRSDLNYSVAATTCLVVALLGGVTALVLIVFFYCRITYMHNSFHRFSA